MPRRPMTVEDLWELPRVGSPVPGPDGTWCVVPVTTGCLETNEITTRLWWVSTRGKGKPRPLTVAGAFSGQPAISPDGSRLAFVRKPGGDPDPKGPAFPDQPQLYVMSMDGGEPERLTDCPFGVTDPRWFPDGRRIAFLAGVYRDALTLEAAARKKRKLREDPVRAAVTEDRVYRFWDRWLTGGEVHHLFALDLETREMLDLLPRSRRWFGLMDPSGAYAIAPDGREIAFAACRTPPPYDLILWGVFTVRVPSRIHATARVKDPKRITGDHVAGAYRPRYSPDGRWIVYGIQREFDFYADRVRLVAYDRRRRTHTVLTEDWDRSAGGWNFDPDSRRIFLVAENNARTAIYRLDLRRALRNPKGNPPEELVCGGTFGEPMPAGGRLLTTLHSLRGPAEVVTLGLNGKSLRTHTAFCREKLRGIELGAVREEVFEGAGGDPVQMFLVYPPGKRKGRLPLVHLVHGGPHGTFGDAWHWRWNAQVFAARGYLVALVNFHGSTSWGQQFAASIHGRWGDQPYRDIMAATDHLIRHGRVDPERAAVAGGSYGGYLVAWIASQTDRFACIVNHAGVSDLMAQYASDVTQGWPRSMGGEPWDRIEAIDRWNPVRFSRGFTSPMLILHGEKDYRVPYTLGIEIYNIHRAMKIPARLVVYPDEGHWILKPANSVHWYREVLAWLDRWLKRGRKTRRRGRGRPASGRAGRRRGAASVRVSR